MDLSFFNEDVEIPKDLDIQKVQDVYRTIVTDHNKKVDYINIIFCSDDYLLNINQQYLEHDYFTDIITFDYSDTAIASDVFISVDRIADNASSINVSFQSELYRILFHGVLHLVGYKDKEPADKKLMTEKEDFYLSLI